MAYKVFILDDESTLRLSLQMFLQDEGYEVETEGTIKKGWTMIEHIVPDILLLDIRLPDGNGIEILKKVKDKFPDIAVIMLTAYGDTKTTVEAIKAGAFDYMTKPFELEELLMTINKWRKQHQLEKQVEFYREEERRTGSVQLLGHSVKMKELKDKIHLVSQSNDTTVLLRGETGTGKELVARSIHQNSIRKASPFVAVNCGAIPNHLVESELFGYEKGAFTGATLQKKGLVEWADQGTLFLDEIGELPLEVQVKLLRFLEDKRVKRIGGLKEIAVDVRVIGASNRNLEEMVKEGSFRSDLYYRLNVVPLLLSPLRERDNDIILLADHYIIEFSQQMGKNPPVLTTEAKNRLLFYHWPGNIRELKNVIERLLILKQSKEINEIDLEFLHLNHPQNDQSLSNTSIEKEGFSLEETINEIEKRFIMDALEKTKWKVTKAANLLGISRYSLQRRIEKYNL